MTQQQRVPSRLTQFALAAMCLFLPACSTDDKTTRPDKEQTWSQPVQALNQLLHDNKDKKHIVAYWAHGSVILRNFYQKSDFWAMLKANDFKTQMEESAESFQKQIDAAARSGQAIENIIDEDHAAMFHAAFEKGIRIKAVDRGLQVKFDPYLEFVDGGWTTYKEKQGLHFTAEESEKEVDAQANHVRDLLKDPVLWELREDYKMSTLKRLRDEATGTFSAQTARNVAGKVWQIQGSAHFTPCGLDTYLSNPLIIEMFESRQDM
jgi:hypothetical protein